MLLPTSIVAINQAGLSLKYERIFAPISPLLLSNSIFNLFEEIKAISIPEKKAEHKREKRTKENRSKMDIYFFWSFCELTLFNLIRKPLRTKYMPHVNGTSNK